MTPARRLLAYGLRYRRPFLLGFACVIMATTISLAGPWVLKLAVDDLNQGVSAEKVVFYGAAVLGLALVGGVFRFLMRRVIVGASRSIEFDLRNDFFAHLQTLHLGYFHGQRTGDLMSRATNDLGAVRMMIGPAVMYAASTTLTFIVAIALMISIDLRLTLIALTPLPLLTVLVRYLGGIVHRRFEGIQQQLSEISAIAQETLSGVRVVRAYGQEAFETERFRHANEEYVRMNLALLRFQAFFFPTMGLLMGAGALLMLWLGGRAVIEGRMTVGELVAFNTYLMMLAWPMIAFGWVTTLIQRGAASWKRMLEVMDAPPAIVDADVQPSVAPAEAMAGDVEFRHLTFAYNGHVVLNDVSAVLPAGTTTAIVGATGSGKSTLLSLLPRLYDPPAGSVLVGGVDVRDLPLGELRRAIGFVPQESFLFGATVAENIAFGARQERGSASEVEEAARVSRIDKDVAGFPRGYDTIVGERGITLSGGQKQRTTLARALLTEPRILILDDALSAVDTYTEEEILRGLQNVMRRRTSILVSHRISTVRGADQILVMSEGRIVERGTHSELVAHGGLYADLYNKQLLEEELDAS